MLITIVGLLAAALTSRSYIPRVKKALPAGSTDDLSAKTLAVLATGLALWIAYGFLKSDYVIIVANALALPWSPRGSDSRSGMPAEASRTRWPRHDLECSFEALPVLLPPAIDLLRHDLEVHDVVTNFAAAGFGLAFSARVEAATPP